ncbi:MAG: hypothetical protein ACI8WB_001728 [Phenylobacterium sp.]|jgi:hypothetical protein
MGFEQDIAQLVTASSDVTGIVDTHLNGFESRVAVAEGKVDQYMVNPLLERSHYRLTKNQRLLGTDGSVPDGWSAAPNVTFKLIHTVSANTPWADRPEVEKEIMVAMGLEGHQYLMWSFNIWQVDWTEIGQYHYTLFQKINTSGLVTVAAMTKIISGHAHQSWLTGAGSEWKLTGEVGYRNNLGYTHIHPNKSSDAGSFQFALPAAVAGHVRIDQNKWGLYPYIGDTQND